MKNLMRFAFLLVVSASFHVNANLIKIEHFDVNSQEIALKSYWDSYGGTKHTYTLNGDATLLFNGSGNNNTIYKMTIDLSSDSAKNISIFAGLDAGWGAEVYYNGVQSFDNDTGIWWRRNWQDSSIISLTGLGATAGQNILEIFWSENSNSGGNSFEIMEARIGRVALSESSVAAAVPEPSLVALFSLAILSLVRFRKPL